MAVGEVFWTQPVVESSIAVLSLNYTSHSVALDVRGTLQVNDDVTISRLLVIASSLVGAEETRELAINTVEAHATEVMVEESLDELQLTIGERFDASFAAPTIVLRGTTRRVTNTPLLCGGVLLVAGVGDRNELDVCAAFGIATHRCVYDGDADAWIIDGHTDYTCPYP